MGSKFTKLDERFSVIEYPVTFAEMIEESKNYLKQNGNFINMLSML